MNFKTTLDLLMKNGKIQVQEKLTSGQRKAVDKGYAIMRAYQDKPSNIPYMFRPIRYFLIISDWFEWTLKNKEKSDD
jgi:serine/threonine protein kinase HipA of HipAB toxin-antitoxin module